MTQSHILFVWSNLWVRSRKILIKSNWISNKMNFQALIKINWSDCSVFVYSHTTPSLDSSNVNAIDQPGMQYASTAIPDKICWIMTKEFQNSNRIGWCTCCTVCSFVNIVLWLNWQVHMYSNVSVCKEGKKENDWAEGFRVAQIENMVRWWRPHTIRCQTYVRVFILLWLNGDAVELFLLLLLHKIM